MPNIPIPVMSTVAFSGFMSSAPTASIGSSDNIFFIDNSGNLKKINASNFISAVASNFIGTVSNFDSATTSGYYQINSSGTSNGPGVHGGEKYPGVLEVTNMGSSIVRQIARISTNGYSYRDLTLNNGTVSSKSDWVWIPYSAANGISLATASASGLMSSVQFTKLNNLTTGTATSGSNGYMTSTMVNNLTTAYNHASAAPNISSKNLGFYKVGYDSHGHITGSTTVAKSDLNYLGLLSTVTATSTTRANQTPGFGNTFNIYYTKQDANAKITEASATVKIPDDIVTTSSNGLMSSRDKAKLNSMFMQRLLFTSSTSSGAYANLCPSGDSHFLVKTYTNNLSKWGIWLVYLDGGEDTRNFAVKKIASSESGDYTSFFKITDTGTDFKWVELNWENQHPIYKFTKMYSNASLAIEFIGSEHYLVMTERTSSAGTNIRFYPTIYESL